MKNNAKLNYSFEDDIFSAIPVKREYDSSVQMGEFVFDLDSKGKIIGIEILDFSKILNIPKFFLNRIESLKIDILTNEEKLKLQLTLVTKARNSEIISNLNIERINPDLILPSKLSMAVV